MGDWGRKLSSRVYAHALLPYFEPRSYRGVTRVAQQYEAMERLPLQVNLDAQWEAVGRMLRHAYETSPYYRRLWKECGISPEQIQSPDDLKQIPALTRDDLRSHGQEMCSSRFTPKEMMKAATGGTTDTPVTLYRSTACLPYKNAVQARFNAWADYLPGDKTFFLWGAQSDYPANPSWRWRFYDQKLMRRYFAPTSVFNPEIFVRYTQKLNTMRPQVIYAYPTPLALFSEYLLASGKDYHRPRVVICTAELLSDEFRAVIQKTFECPVFDHFGARDFGMIAAECSAHDGLHLHPLSAFIEHLPLEGESGLTEMFVTDLLNFGMPLIRYKVNDCSLVGPQGCSCGVGYPKIQKVVGRMTDNFYLADGTVVSGVVARRLGNYCPGIRKLQIIQEAVDRFVVRYVPGDEVSEADITMLRKKLEDAFGDVRLDLQPVADIPRERSGKTRLCITHVKPPSNLHAAGQGR